MLDSILKEMTWLAREKSKLSTWAYAFLFSLIAGSCHAYFYDNVNFGLVTTAASVFTIFIIHVTLSFITLFFRGRA
ncbi:hypothetical protein BM526_18735 (plasmid) [Alteromonas mediterranea]|nr:hypothetical protein BM526_18735 [Alteromonas mediterranea]